MLCLIKINLLAISGNYATEEVKIVDRFMSLNRLIGWVLEPINRDSPTILYPKPILCNVLMELCAIRDNITTCDIASITDIIAMIEDNVLINNS